MKDVFIIGSKGIPAKYGGFETFVDKLTEYNMKQEGSIKYHVSCLSDNSKEFVHNNARCFNINVPNIGPAKAVYYDILAFKESLRYIKENDLKDSTIYVLACRIGPFFGNFVKKAHKLGAKVYVNPDGHEWLRAKWNYAIRKYWKYSERLMVKHADLLICDSTNIEKYILESYSRYNPKTTYIAYGADLEVSKLGDGDVQFKGWLDKFGLSIDNYYLIVGRFVPENNYETMIREFMTSKSTRDLAIITNYENNSFFDTLQKKLNLKADKRIKFVGTVYDQELLKKIREKAFAYLHGHEVGGTNPSLLEAFSLTNLNLLLNVGFNREVGEYAALFWNKDNLSEIINSADEMEEKVRQEYGRLAKERIYSKYSWQSIADKYKEIWYKYD